MRAPLAPKSRLRYDRLDNATAGGRRPRAGPLTKGKRPRTTLSQSNPKETLPRFKSTGRMRRCPARPHSKSIQIETTAPPRGACARAAPAAKARQPTAQRAPTAPRDPYAGPRVVCLGFRVRNSQSGSDPLQHNTKMPEGNSRTLYARARALDGAGARAAAHVSLTLSLLAHTQLPSSVLRDCCPTNRRLLKFCGGPPNVPALQKLHVRLKQRALDGNAD